MWVGLICQGYSQFADRHSNLPDITDHCIVKNNTNDTSVYICKWFVYKI